MKRAALLFDRVYVSTASDSDSYFGIPVEITFGFHEADRETVAALDEVRRELQRPEYLDRQFTPEQFVAELERINTLIFLRAYRGHVEMTPVFQVERESREVFQTGPDLLWQAALEQIPVVVEERVSWEQVLDFRKDQIAVRQYRALRNWMRLDTPVGSADHARDLVEERIDLYKAAVRKHGLATKTGAVKAVVGSVFGGALATSLSLGPGVVAVFAAAGAVASLVEYRGTLAYLRSTENREIAVVCDAKQLI